MILLKLCSAFVVVSCLGYWCHGEEQPEARSINNEASIGSMQPLLKSWNTRDGKRHNLKSPNVHIENVYVPQRIQTSDTFGRGYPIYPYNAYPAIPQYYAVHEDSEILEKPAKLGTKLITVESPIPGSATRKSSYVPQMIYGNVNAEQDNEYITSPYPFMNQQNIVSMLSSTGGKNPYFFIINTPHSIGHNIPKPSLSSVAVEESIDEDSEKESSKPLIIQSQPNQLSKSHPYLKVSEQSFDNLGLSVAKYILGHPLYSANDMANIRGQSKILIGDDKRGHDDNLKDSVDHDVVEVAADDDYITEADELTTKDVKLPLEFLWRINNPEKKVDDRVALVYVRHTKRGRNMQLTH